MAGEKEEEGEGGIGGKMERRERERGRKMGKE